MTLPRKQNVGVPGVQVPFVNPDGFIQAPWFRMLAKLAGEVFFNTTTGLVANGTEQFSATPLGPDWNVVSTSVAGMNDGVLCPVPLVGTGLWVWNRASDAVQIYPSVSCQIDSLGVNAPYSLAPGKAQFFATVLNNLLLSFQLG